MLTTLLCINEQDNELFRKVVSGDFKYKDGKDKYIDLEKFFGNKFKDNNETLEITIKIEDYISIFIHHYERVKREHLQTPSNTL